MVPVALNLREKVKINFLIVKHGKNYFYDSNNLLIKKKGLTY